MRQSSLFSSADLPLKVSKANSSTFAQNMKMPVHRWFRYSAGFSATWAEEVIQTRAKGRNILDPFAGSGTTLLAAQAAGASAAGVEAHPFIYRVAEAKLNCTADSGNFRQFADSVLVSAKNHKPDLEGFPDLVRRCYPDDVLGKLDRIRQAIEETRDGSSEWALAWLCLVGILRACSPSGTAQWQYVLPKKSKAKSADPYVAYSRSINEFVGDMDFARDSFKGQSHIIRGDARSCPEVPDDYAGLVVTSPPYANNYDYADATRLEMSFFREIEGYGDLGDAVRKHLMRSCSQHETSKTVDVNAMLASKILAPIASELAAVHDDLAETRLTKGGKKNYQIMAVCYFFDLAHVWRELRRCCTDGAEACFVVGDSAPYGVYMPVMDWLGRLAVSEDFASWSFEKTRDRNIKWKNRKHDVPLCEGRLWVQG